MAALDSYHAGEIESIVECVLDALELAVVLGTRLAQNVDAVLEEWRVLITERRGSAAHALPSLLVRQPVVDTAYVSKELGITDRAARDLIDKACERGILSKMGNAKRGAFYQAGELIDLLEEASNTQGVRRAAMISQAR